MLNVNYNAANISPQTQLSMNLQKQPVFEAGMSVTQVVFRFAYYSSLGVLWHEIVSGSHPLRNYPHDYKVTAEDGSSYIYYPNNKITKIPADFFGQEYDPEIMLNIWS